MSDDELRQIKERSLPPLREPHSADSCLMLGRPHRGKCYPHERNTDVFTCPDCKISSPNPNDVKYCYCAMCHNFKFQTVEDVRCMEPSCIDFGDPSFGDGTCPEEHAVPPARRR